MTFSERSHFANWIRILLVLSIIIMSMGIFQYRINVALWMLIPLLILFVLLLFSNLWVQINTEKISLRFFPFHFKKINYNIPDISKIQLVTYRPISKFGGWGIRFNLNNEKIYSTSGNHALLLETKGKKIYIGIQDVEAVKKFMLTHFPSLYVSSPQK